MVSDTAPLAVADAVLLAGTGMDRMLSKLSNAQVRVADPWRCICDQAW